MARSLWHYTCDHGHKALGDSGTLLPISCINKDARAKMPDHLKMLVNLIWFTDLAMPEPDALGLTMRTLSCDRTKYRYRALDIYSIGRYASARHIWDVRMCAELEEAPGAKPEHWWVSYAPVPVVYSPQKRRTLR